MPKTRSGKWAVGFGIALAVVMAFEVIFAFAIGGDPAVIDRSPFLSMLAAALSIAFTLTGPLSFFVGMYTIIKHEEWSVWKPLAILYLLTAVLFALGEFSFPH